MTTTDTKYNGWTNYETWNVKLWMDSDESELEHIKELAREAKANPYKNRYMELERRIVHTLVVSLKEYFGGQLEAWMPDQSSCFTDLLNSAVSSVNWYEIAESVLEDLEEE
jgi:hypothetical protein